MDGSRWSSLASSCLRSTSSLPQRASSTSLLWTLSTISKQQCSMKIDLFPSPTFLDSAEQCNSEDVSLSMPGRTCEDVSVVILAVGDGDFTGIHLINRIDSSFWQFPITFQRCQHSDTLADHHWESGLTRRADFGWEDDAQGPLDSKLHFPHQVWR